MKSKTRLHPLSLPFFSVLGMLALNLTPANATGPHAYSPFENLEKDLAEEENQARWEYRQDRVLVKMKAPREPGKESQQTFKALSVPDPALAGTAIEIDGVRSLTKLFPKSNFPQKLKVPQGDQLVAKPDLSRWMLATLEQDANPVEVLAALRRSELVEFAEPDYLFQLAGIIPDGTQDPRMGQQWHLETIRAREAWAHLEAENLPPGGSPDVVVAVIDSGVDYSHSELAPNMWVNSREIPGNGIDDDQNGIVDDIHGADFVGSSGDHSGNPDDDNGHGTHVAGIIAAAANNGVGGVGIAYNSKIMAIKAAQYSGVLSSSDIAEAIYYAVENGADVINMSFASPAESNVVQDALAVAFGQAVLVASAGNQGRPNEESSLAVPYFPASYIYVLGVMAETVAGFRPQFSNWDYIPNSRIEYELMAPGLDIASTLPDDGYAVWDGTSMSAAVVSGTAALVRTKFADKSLYSSRFIMGQIASTGGGSLDAFAALTETPTPHLSFLDTWVFDSPTATSPENDGDGIVDAGETVELAVAIKNRWGKADPVTVTLEARAPGAVNLDPYVTWDVDSVSYGAVGNFGEDDNGLIYTNDLITGVQNPFRFSVSDEAPNDHVIVIEVTITAGNGFDENDPDAPYVYRDSFELVVQKGRTLPSIFESDLVMTKDDYWIIDKPVLIPEGVNVRVTEGTQIQFWSSESTEVYATNPEPYLQVEGNLFIEGTAEEPISLFPSGLFPSERVEIRTPENGFVEMKYFQLMNPRLGNNYSQDKGNIYMDYGYITQSGPQAWSHTLNADRYQLYGQWVSNTRFRKLGGLTYDVYNSSDPTDASFLQGTPGRSCLFDQVKFHYALPATENSVFLQNYMKVTNLTGSMIQPSVFGGFSGSIQRNRFDDVFSVLNTYQTSYGAYLVVWPRTFANPRENRLQDPHAFASKLGGTIASFESEAEIQSLVAAMSPDYAESGEGFTIGLHDYDGDGNYEWFGNEDLQYQPEVITEDGEDSSYVALRFSRWGDPALAEANYGYYLIKLPTLPSEEEIEQARSEMLYALSTFHDNAYLNHLWRPDLQYWGQFKLQSLASRDYLFFVPNNYWGTENSDLIDRIFWDRRDDFNLGEFVYEPLATKDDLPETAFPFVVDCVISTETDPDAQKVGAEEVTFTITFSKDMNTSVAPSVSFGPDAPLTDYSLNPVDGGWQDARTWVGRFEVNPITGDGYQLMRIANAEAADNPWFTNGEDAGRFRFEIITSGVEALTLQAASGEGFIDLTWVQDDFDLLAGYNIYRASSENGAYQRLNSAVLPAGNESYRDLNVLPGQSYFYKFRVVKSDMSESADSNITEGTPLDTIPPAIQHTPVSDARPQLSLTISANITDNLGVTDAHLFFRRAGAQEFRTRAMMNTTGNRWSVTLEGTVLEHPGVEYYLSATDGRSTTLAARPEQPFFVMVEDRPVITSITPGSGPAAGGTEVTVSGTNFKEGAVVRFGSATAMNPQVVNGTQIAVESPAHIPSTVSVTVENPDGASDTSLNGFTYLDDSVTVYLADVQGSTDSFTSVSLDVANVSGLVAADILLTFDPGVLSLNSARAGRLNSSWSFVHHSPGEGQLRLSSASDGESVNGSGSLAELEFRILGNPGDVSPLSLTFVSLNDNSITSRQIDGSITVSAGSRLGGSVYFWGETDRPVPDVRIELQGAGLQINPTDSEGRFFFSALPAGDYTLTPSFNLGVQGISAFDAARILRHSVGLEPLSGLSAIAADANRNGSINSMDAYHVLRHSAGIEEISVPGGGVSWVFNPEMRSYPQLSLNQNDQDFSAVLLGDVTGNWTHTGLQNGESVMLCSHDLVDYRGDRTVARILVDSAGARVYGVDLMIQYDPSVVLSKISAEGLTGVFNTRKRGEIRAALATPSGITGAQSLLQLEFVGQSSPELTLVSASMNEGALVSGELDSKDAFDSDGDGLLDLDESELFGTRIDTIDTDGDGMSDSAEIFAGTDPIDARSIFRIVKVSQQGDRTTVVTWLSSPGRRYQVERRADLKAGSWLPHGDPVVAEHFVTSAILDHQDGSTGRKHFFRVRILE